MITDLRQGGSCQERVGPHVFFVAYSEQLSLKMN